MFETAARAYGGVATETHEGFVDPLDHGTGAISAQCRRQHVHRIPSHVTALVHHHCARAAVGGGYLMSCTAKSFGAT